MERDDPREKMIRVLVFLVLLLFTAGIVAAGWLSHGVGGPPRPASMPPVVKDSMNTINGMLALNLGAYFGISTLNAKWSDQPIGSLQRVACWVYVIDFILAAVFWGLVRFTDDPTRVVSILPTIVVSGLGVVFALFGAALGVGKFRAQ